MNTFIDQIIFKMRKPNEPKSQSDLEVIKELLSDKFITFHTALIKQGERIMADINDVKAAIANLKATVVDEAVEVTTELGLLGAQIEALQAQLANGSAVSAAELDELLASIQGVTELVEGIIETAAPVEPTPSEEPAPAEETPVTE